MLFKQQMEEVIDYIEDKSCNEDIKKFLIQSFILEYQKAKTGAFHYYRDYDKLIDSFIDK